MGIDSIVVGPVLPGNGIAWISSPVAADYTETGPLPGGSGDLDGDEKTDTVIPGNSRCNPNKRLVSAGNTGVSVVMNFEAVGTMDGGEKVREKRKKNKKKKKGSQKKKKKKKKKS